MAVGDVPVQDAWMEVPLGDGWMAAYRLSVAGGRRTFSELRIFPDEGGMRDAGQWSGEFLGWNAKAPKALLSTRLVRRASPERAIKLMEECLINAKKQSLSTRALGPMEAPRRGVGRGGGRADRPIFYADFALKYHALEQNASGRQSTRQRLAQQYNKPETTIISYIRAARKLGFLEKTTPGKRGGVATDLARDVAGQNPLADAERESARQRGRMRGKP